MPPVRRFADFVTQRDHRLMRRLSCWSPPRWVRLWMMSSSRAGDGWLWASLAVPILWLGGTARYRAMVVLATAVVLGLMLFLILKRLIGRERPCSINPICWARLIPPDRFSFPSGHSITAFAITVPLSMFYPAYMVGLLFCALSVAMSRVVLGLHFLSDVIAGSLMGAGIGYATYALMV
jgi:undecaprenyl-diphosphatase